MNENNAGILISSEIVGGVEKEKYLYYESDEINVLQ